MKQVIIMKYVKWPVTHNNTGHTFLKFIWNSRCYRFDLPSTRNYKSPPGCCGDREEFQERETKIFLVTRLLKTAYIFFF